MFEKIHNKCEALSLIFDKIEPSRKIILEKISHYILEKNDHHQTVNLIYICTHNSRRSHFGQVWAAVAANYYGIKNVHTFSGGTEATAFNPNAIKALRDAGFEITADDNLSNPVYTVKFGENEMTHCFSKVYSHKANPKSDFAAIMTCSDAEENCPFIPGAEFRIGTTYDDPKAFDGTSQQDEKYSERSDQIALECLYVFSKIPNSKF